MKKLIIILVCVLILCVNCNKTGKIQNSNNKNSFNVYTPTEITENSHYVHNSTEIPESLSRNENNEYLIRRIEKNGRKYLVFPDSSEVDIWANCINIGTHNLRIYKEPSKESEYIIVNNSFAVVLSLPDIEDWLYYHYTEDPDYGFIYVYDLQSDFEEENKILQKITNVKRYGPLLEIYTNNYVVKFWDYFGGEISSKHYVVQKYYEEYDEILIGKYGYEWCEGYTLYNIKKDHSSYFSNVPIFNSSRNAAFSVEIDDRFFEGVDLAIYTSGNNGYIEIFHEKIFNDRNIGYSKNEYWLNDNEFKIELVSWAEGNKTIELTGKRIGTRFELIYD
jgi:hypothetical protein